MIINLSNYFNLILLLITTFIALFQLKKIIFYKYYIEISRLNNL